MGTAIQALPLVRSGELFTQHSEDFRTQYFDGVAASPAGAVTPEHVFGVNGWQRMLAESGADPVVATLAFDGQWDALPFAARRDLVVGNAVARFYAPGVAESAFNRTLEARRDAGAVIAKNPDIGFLAADNPVAASEEFQKKLFGEYAEPTPDPFADLMAAGEEGTDAESV